MNGHSGNGAGRKPGDWIAEARMRARKEREPMPDQRNKCVPKLSDVGSAAYRRLLAKRGTDR